MSDSSSAINIFSGFEVEALSVQLDPSRIVSPHRTCYIPIYHRFLMRAGFEDGQILGSGLGHK